MKKYEEMQSVLHDILSNSAVRKMKKYMQHGRVSTYEHCKNVAKLSYDINRIFSLKANLRVLLTGAMLHDFYLYDWHDYDGGSHQLHGFRHAKTALDNAIKHFGIDEKTGSVIYSHMWPLNLRRIPKSKEAWIVCIADKCVSLHETLFRRHRS